MIDFRYHLVSIVAVFLSLGLGLLMGSALLEDPIVDRLEAAVDSVRADNARIRADVTDLRDRLRVEEDFARAVAPSMVGGALSTHSVVLIQFEGTSQELIDDTRRIIEEAQGEVASTLILRRRFGLSSEDDIASLAGILGGVEQTPEELRERAGAVIGDRVALAAATPLNSGSEASSFARERALDLLNALEEGGYVDVERESDDGPVPGDASFVLISGASEEAPFPVSQLGLPLALGLARHGGLAVAVAPFDDQWRLIDALRGDGDARAAISTVGGADLASQGVAVVLALEQLVERHAVGHYGPGAADGLIPGLEDGSAAR